MKQQAGIIFIAVACLAIVSACGKQGADDKTETSTAKTEPALRLYTLDCGGILAKQPNLFDESDSLGDEPQELAVPCYLIRHPDGDLLWDSGLSEDMATAVSESDAFKLWLNRPLSAELADAGVSIADIDYFAMSHSHFDHSGNARLLLNATWIASSAEIAFTKSEFGQTMGVGEVFSIPDTTKIREISEDHDVFGDGTVTLIQTPGHSGGHMALLLRLEESGSILLSGDLYHYQESRDRQLVPKFNLDADQTRKSMVKFEALAKETGARVVIQHSKAEFETFPRPPEFLQ